MKVSDTYLLKKIYKKYYLIPVGQAVVNRENVIEVNGIGFDILSFFDVETELDESIVLNELCKYIYSKYDIKQEDKDSVNEFLIDFVERMKRIRVLEYHF